MTRSAAPPEAVRRSAPKAACLIWVKTDRLLQDRVWVVEVEVRERMGVMMDQERARKVVGQVREVSRQRRKRVREVVAPWVGKGYRFAAVSVVTRAYPVT